MVNGFWACCSAANSVTPSTRPWAEWQKQQTNWAQAVAAVVQSSLSKLSYILVGYFACVYMLTCVFISLKEQREMVSIQNELLIRLPADRVLCSQVVCMFLCFGQVALTAGGGFFHLNNFRKWVCYFAYSHFYNLTNHSFMGIQLWQHFCKAGLQDSSNLSKTLTLECSR